MSFLFWRHISRGNFKQTAVAWIAIAAFLISYPIDALVNCDELKMQISDQIFD